MGFGGGKVDAREAARMGLGVGIAAAAAPAAAPPGRGGGNADDETASMFKQFKLGMLTLRVLRVRVWAQRVRSL
jgi:hypothetical protein